MCAGPEAISVPPPGPGPTLGLHADQGLGSAAVRPRRQDHAARPIRRTPKPLRPPTRPRTRPITRRVSGSSSTPRDDGEAITSARLRARTCRIDGESAARTRRPIRPGLTNGIRKSLLLKKLRSSGRCQLIASAWVVTICGLCAPALPLRPCSLPTAPGRTPCPGPSRPRSAHEGRQKRPFRHRWPWGTGRRPTPDHGEDTAIDRDLSRTSSSSSAGRVVGSPAR